jgi:hypothetical protein
MSSILHIEGTFILKNNVIFTCDELIIDNHESKIIIQDNAELIINNKINFIKGKIVLLNNGKITYLKENVKKTRRRRLKPKICKYINHKSIQLFMCLLLICINIYSKKQIFYSNRNKKKLYKKIKKLFKKISQYLHQ